LEKTTSTNYWSLVWQRFKKNKGAKWSFNFFIILIWIAILNPFIAGDVPIYASIKGESSFPVLKKYLIDLGLAKQESNFSDSNSWHTMEYDAVIRPIIPYSATYKDYENDHFKSPLGPQKMKKGQAWHYLGTNNLGQDVAAGMVSGVVVALQVGLFSMLLATIIGVFMGAIAGYYGDHQLKVKLGTIIFNSIAVFLSLHFAFISRSYQLAEGHLASEILKSLGITSLIFLISNVLSKVMQQISFLKKEINIPIDLIIMRLVEIMNSVPPLLIIIAVAAIFSSQSLIPLIIIIAMVRWTSIARFLRAELLKVRNMEYIQAAKAMGFSQWRILLRHAIPNAIGPVLIIIAFGIAGAILAEATLAFLGIGSDSNRVSWGTLLHLARGNESKWWLAIFPGLAIFMTVMTFNLIGEGLKAALDSKEI
jgi:peptide/nickel transport system permease protein